MSEGRPNTARLMDHFRLERQKPEANIIEEVADFIRRFVFFRHNVLYDLVSAWSITTYLTERFEYSGYLFAHSPEPQSGKSRLLEVLDFLVNNSSGGDSGRW